VFDNLVFDAWLTKKSEQILYKVDRETISTEEMLVLILKAQTNHFHHMDVEFRHEFKNLREEFIDVRNESRDESKNIRSEMKEEFQNVRSEMSDGFEKMWKFMMWQGGVLLALFAGLYLKLFLG